jgi:hypothetical protein
MFVRKQLAFQEVASAQAAVYTAPAGVKALVHNIVMHNMTVNSETVGVSYHDGVTERALYRLALPPGDTVNLGFYNEGLVVMPGASLRMGASAASAINVKIDGTEES